MAASSSKNYLKAVLGIVVLLATIVVFTIYLKHNPAIWRTLQTVSVANIVLLFGLYSFFMLTLIGIQTSTILLCGTRLSHKENFLLTIYSSIINFFGPLQSGPGFRAAYLKQRHGTKLKTYSLATLLYYGFYALFSGLFLLHAITGWWGICLLVLLFVAAMYALLRLDYGWIRGIKQLQLKLVGWLAFATLLQVITITVIYYVELHSIGQHVSYGQAIIYAGAANFALFVSITPGAIGFRESFLLFSRRLHHIPASAIATASLLDRAVYVLLLAVLFVVVVSLHAKDFLGLKQTNNTPS
jgi:uncharacterized membrane protein YbhN (UPF0104 family)